MYPSSPRASLASRIWAVASRPWAGVGIAMGVLTLSTAALVGTTTSGASPLPTLLSQSSVSDGPLASVSPKASLKDGLANLTIELSQAESRPITLHAVVGDERRDIVVPAGQTTTAVSVPAGGKLRIPVRLTSSDVLTMNGIALIDD